MASQIIPEIKSTDRPLQIALVGNPNTGKTTLFNALTGLRQRIGNYPGITVSMSTGTVFLGKEAAYITDLPGTYSLSASSPDEKIVHDYINGNIPNTAEPDVLVCVVDATNITKNLYLASQLAEHKIPMVIALSFWDSVTKNNARFEVELLSKRLHIPVIPINVTKNEGIADLKKAITDVRGTNQRMVRIKWEEGIQKAIDEFKEKVGKEGVEINTAEANRLIFDSSAPTLQTIDANSHVIKKAVNEARHTLRISGFHPHTAESVGHYRHLHQILEGVIIHGESKNFKRGESIDKLLTHRFWGLTIFVFFMYLVFQAVYSWSSPFMDFVDFGKGYLQQLVATNLGNYPQLQSLLTDGVIEGVGAFLIFLPQILILFFFISLLEETGYMARAAFLMDRMFSWCGLNGKSFVPLLSSFACAVPGVLAARTIEDKKSRVITVLIAPLMSCSARLPVYVLMIGALIEPRYGPFVAGITLFGIHFLGVLVALPTAYFLHKIQKKTPTKPFIIEMPEYQIPKLQNLIWRMWSEGKEFVIRAGTIIFSITIIIWALLYFPRPTTIETEVIEQVRIEFLENGWTNEAISTALEDEESEIAKTIGHRIDSAYINQSYLSRVGKSIQPIFDLAGFDWRISVGILASFPAREVIVSTLGVMFSLGGEVDEESPTLREAMGHATWSKGPRQGQPLFTIPVAFAIMVFFALCQQCGSTLAVIRSETNTKWAIFSFVYMTSIAWISAVLTYQGLTWILP